MLWSRDALMMTLYRTCFSGQIELIKKHDARSVSNSVPQPMYLR
jgi:hypothetical protein